MVDQEILREVDVMKATGASRREMSYHVARRLLLDKGIRPSTQLIREYTQLGSTGDIAADLRYFWEQVAQQLKHPPLLNIRNLDPSLRSDMEELLSALVGTIESRYESQKNEELSRLSMECSERIDGLERRHKEIETSLRSELDALQEKHTALLHESILSSQQLTEQLQDAQQQIASLQALLAKERAEFEARQRFADELLATTKEEAKQRVEWLERTNEVLNGEIQFAKSQIEESRQLYKTAVKDLERNLWALKDELAAKTSLIEEMSKKNIPFKIKKRAS